MFSFLTLLNLFCLIRNIKRYKNLAKLVFFLDIPKRRNSVAEYGILPFFFERIFRRNTLKDGTFAKRY